ncbi:allantoate amidohydrolase [soil metagenome]
MKLEGLAQKVMERCDTLAQFSEDEGALTRTFLSEPVHGVHEQVRSWLEAAGMSVRVDAVGNIAGRRAASNEDAPTLLIGSHFDTVRDAGRYDGMLGVLSGIAAAEALRDTALPFHLELVGFSEEEGVRFGVPFLGSKAVTGAFDREMLGLRDENGVSVAEAISNFGLNPADISGAAYDPEKLLGFVEVHIEQGPHLAALNRPLGVVSAVAGATRARVTFTGQAGHAGTTPMTLRRDALVGGAAFVLEVERHARGVPGLIATVGQIAASPGAPNVIPGAAVLSLDVRHATDEVRLEAVAALQAEATEIAAARDLGTDWQELLNQAAVPLDPGFQSRLAQAAGNAPTLVSGAGHDVMVMASFTPSALMFVRSPNGVSHNPAETVLLEDVAAALAALITFVRGLRA